MPALTRPSNARKNYDCLLNFARHVKSIHPGHAVRVVHQGSLGLGLQATRDIFQGDVIVRYGGPYVRLRKLPSEHATHCAQVIDPNETTQELTTRDDVIARGIDGKILSAAFHDPEVTNAERDELLLITGAIMNSTKDQHGNDIMIETVKWSSNSGLLRWTSLEGIEFAARSMVAAHFIPAGADLRWAYPYKGHDTEPLGFRDMHSPPPPPLRPKKRIVPTSNQSNL